MCQGRRSHLSWKNTSCPGEMRLIVPVSQMVHPNPFVGICGMDKLAAADINADVGDTVLIGVFEEN